MPSSSSLYAGASAVVTAKAAAAAVGANSRAATAKECTDAAAFFTKALSRTGAQPNDRQREYVAQLTAAAAAASATAAATSTAPAAASVAATPAKPKAASAAAHDAFYYVARCYHAGAQALYAHSPSWTGAAVDAAARDKLQAGALAAVKNACDAYGRVRERERLDCSALIADAASIRARIWMRRSERPDDWTRGADDMTKSAGATRAAVWTAIVRTKEALRAAATLTPLQHQHLLAAAVQSWCHADAAIKAASDDSAAVARDEAAADDVTGRFDLCIALLTRVIGRTNTAHAITAEEWVAAQLPALHERRFDLHLSVCRDSSPDACDSACRSQLLLATALHHVHHRRLAAAIASAEECAARMKQALVVPAGDDAKKAVSQPTLGWRAIECHRTACALAASICELQGNFRRCEYWLRAALPPTAYSGGVSASIEIVCQLVRVALTKRDWCSAGCLLVAAQRALSANDCSPFTSAAAANARVHGLLFAAKTVAPSDGRDNFDAAAAPAATHAAAPVASAGVVADCTAECFRTLRTLSPAAVTSTAATAGLTRAATIVAVRIGDALRLAGGNTATSSTTSSTGSADAWYTVADALVDAKASAPTTPLWFGSRGSYWRAAIARRRLAAAIVATGATTDQELRTRLAAVDASGAAELGGCSDRAWFAGADAPLWLVEVERAKAHYWRGVVALRIRQPLADALASLHSAAAAVADTQPQVLTQRIAKALHRASYGSTDGATTMRAAHALVAQTNLATVHFARDTVHECETSAVTAKPAAAPVAAATTKRSTKVASLVDAVTDSMSALKIAPAAATTTPAPIRTAAARPTPVPAPLSAVPTPTPAPAKAKVAAEPTPAPADLAVADATPAKPVKAAARGSRATTARTTTTAKRTAKKPAASTKRAPAARSRRAAATVVADDDEDDDEVELTGALDFDDASDGSGDGGEDTTNTMLRAAEKQMDAAEVARDLRHRQVSAQAVSLGAFQKDVQSTAFWTALSDAGVGAVTALDVDVWSQSLHITRLTRDMSTPTAPAPAVSFCLPLGASLGGTMSALQHITSTLFDRARTETGQSERRAIWTQQDRDMTPLLRTVDTLWFGWTRAALFSADTSVAATASTAAVRAAAQTLAHTHRPTTANANTASLYELLLRDRLLPDAAAVATSRACAVAYILGLSPHPNANLTVGAATPAPAAAAAATVVAEDTKQRGKTAAKPKAKAAPKGKGKGKGKKTKAVVVDDDDGGDDEDDPYAASPPAATPSASANTIADGSAFAAEHMPGWPAVTLSSADASRLTTACAAVSATVIVLAKLQAAAYDDAKAATAAAVPPPATVLLLGSALQRLPIESMACVQCCRRLPSGAEVHQPICRVANWPLLLSLLHRRRDAPSAAPVTFDAPVRYLIDPDHSLPHVRLEKYATAQPTPPVSGLCGGPPADPQNWCSSALQHSNLLWYSGHGCAAPWFTPKLTRRARAAASVFMFGCSSAVGWFEWSGEYDFHAVASTYLLSGAPAFVGGLWSLTSKDLEAIALQLMAQCLPVGIAAAGLEAPAAAGSVAPAAAVKPAARGKAKKQPQTVATAPTGASALALPQQLNATRELCTYPHMNAGGLVYFGLPARWSFPSN